MQLMHTLEMDRDVNYGKAKFISYDKDGWIVRYLDSYGVECECPVNIWLSWKVYGYAEILNKLEYMKTYPCVTIGGHEYNLTYFGDGVFSRMNNYYWKMWNESNDLKLFNPPTYSISDLVKVGEFNVN